MAHSLRYLLDDRPAGDAAEPLYTDGMSHAPLRDHMRLLTHPASSSSVTKCDVAPITCGGVWTG